MACFEGNKEDEDACLEKMRILGFFPGKEWNYMLEERKNMEDKE